MDYSKIITIEPGKRSGKPTIRGTRMTVTDVLEYLAGGMTERNFRKSLTRPSAASIGSVSMKNRQVHMHSGDNSQKRIAQNGDRELGNTYFSVRNMFRPLVRSKPLTVLPEPFRLLSRLSVPQ